MLGIANSAVPRSFVFVLKRFNELHYFRKATRLMSNDVWHIFPTNDKLSPVTTTLGLSGSRAETYACGIFNYLTCSG